MARVTVKSIICNGIHNNWSTARILKEIKKRKPESTSDESQVKYYSGQLKRAGEITEERHRKYAGPRGRPSLDSTPVKATAAKKPTVKKVRKSKR